MPSAPNALSADLLVVGGGVNGVGIARDAAGRGLSVVLCEKDDLAAHTSSASTKLIHGGLRYLEHYEFGLVRKALQEREVLLKSAPHIMRPLRFVMPHDPSMRPAWMIRLGIFLYDHLARREVLPASETIRFAGHPAGAPLKAQFTTGFVYSDGWVDDARLVVLCAIDAAERGAQLFTRTRCTKAERGAETWTARLVDAAGNEALVRARALVNAAGPWAGQFLQDEAHLNGHKTLRLIKGSHIVVRKLFDHPYAYIFQNPDRRIVFAIPYEEDFTLVGTTDVEYTGDPGAAAISAEEVDYLCTLINRYFRRGIAPADVVWSYSGVRPLLDDESGDASAVTRDYALEEDHAGAPLLSVWGGKITTFRKLAEEAVDALAPRLGATRPAWTAGVPLPGGDLAQALGATVGPAEAFDRYCANAAARYPRLPAPVVKRYVRAYGTRMDRVVDGGGQEALGEEVLPGLYEAELRYWMREEWARSAEDMLWRRSKLGLHAGPGAGERLEQWLAQHR